MKFAHLLFLLLALLLLLLLLQLLLPLLLPPAAQLVMPLWVQGRSRGITPGAARGLSVVTGGTGSSRLRPMLIRAVLPSVTGWPGLDMMRAVRIASLQRRPNTVGAVTGKWRSCICIHGSCRCRPTLSFSPRA